MIEYLYRPYTDHQYADFVVKHQGKKLCQDSSKVWFEEYTEEELNPVCNHIDDELCSCNQYIEETSPYIIDILEAQAIGDVAYENRLKAHYKPIIEERIRVKKRINELQNNVSIEPTIQSPIVTTNINEHYWYRINGDGYIEQGFTVPMGTNPRTILLPKHMKNNNYEIRITKKSDELAFVLFNTYNLTHRSFEMFSSLSCEINITICGY